MFAMQYTSRISALISVTLSEDAADIKISRKTDLTVIFMVTVQSERKWVQKFLFSVIACLNSLCASIKRLH